ncbi:MAG: UDP-N-acetylglucosamine 2-epimerase (non-hydrolyzing) [Acidobacteria bacterium]|nr:MAG: UDP-N-acetylglucosamine 2-epimerase (non-hydrolyzing) [Acidobacteriota bacterium]
MKIASIVGARPQFVKAAMVSRALRSAGVTETLVHTGQHYDDNMSKVFFEELRIPKPDYNLGIGSGDHGSQTGRMLEALENVLQREKPNWALVYGDTNSTLAGALAAAKLHIPVAHVEAGLRSFNRQMPEEINRIVTDQLSTLLFAPTETAVRNLQREGIADGIHNFGDVMYDAVLTHRELATIQSRILGGLNLHPKTYALATVHRAENTEDLRRLLEIFEALRILSRELPIVLPLHPRTRHALESIPILVNAQLILIEPVSYLDILLLESQARFILTDSGGVQKEAFFFRVPCITLRDETEWVETVDAGWNVVAGTRRESIIQAARSAQAGRCDAYPFGDGNAAQNIARVIGQLAE